MTTMNDEAIRQLRAEAGEAGDLEMVATCDAALAGDADAIDDCQRVISDAAAQDDGDTHDDEEG